MSKTDAARIRKLMIALPTLLVGFLYHGPGKGALMALMLVILFANIIADRRQAKAEQPDKPKRPNIFMEPERPVKSSRPASVQSGNRAPRATANGGRSPRA